MNTSARKTDDRLWQELIEAERRLHEARLRFLAECQDRARVLTEALWTGYRATALRLLPGTPPDVQKAAFPTLVELAATGHSTIGLVREAILAMPRTWVVEHFEEEAEPSLQAIGDEAYRRYAELLSELDGALLSRL